MKNLKVGDSVIVGSCMTTYKDGNRSDKFLPSIFSAKVTKISANDCGQTKVDLDWGPKFGTSKVYEHDYGKLWIKVEEYN